MLNRPRPHLEVPATTTDPLGEALHFLRMSGTFYAHSELTAPWGVAIPPFRNCMMFHVVTDGECWVEAPDEDPHLLQAGDLALLPRGQGMRWSAILAHPWPTCLRCLDWR